MNCKYYFVVPFLHTPYLQGNRETGASSGHRDTASLYFSSVYHQSSRWAFKRCTVWHYSLAWISCWMFFNPYQLLFREDLFFFPDVDRYSAGINDHVLCPVAVIFLCWNYFRSSLGYIKEMFIFLLMPLIYFFFFTALFLPVLTC